MKNRRIYLEHIRPWLNTQKVLIFYGARQVGKTTLLKLLKEEREDMIILSAENPQIVEALESKDVMRLKLIFGNAKIVAIDEAQKIGTIGEILKYLHDAELGIQFIATGSSSFELSNKVTEALTGRNIKFIIHPYSCPEIIDHKGGLWLIENIDRILIYGQYPEIIESDIDKVRPILENLSSDYLYQDILMLDNIRNASIIHRLLKALALQVGAEVRFHEVAKTIGLAPQTVEKYIDLLEKNFIVYSLPSYSKNLRNELRKSKKVYFYDIGVRNALLANYAPLENRNDVGALWENFCINERRKHHVATQKSVNLYFWRTYDQAEIDLIEESDGGLEIFEFKYNSKKAKDRFPKSFMESYDIRKKTVVSKSNFPELWI